MHKYNIVIYHANCHDGFGSASIVYKKLKETYGEEYVNTVEFHAAKYGTVPPFIDGKDVIIVDFSYESEIMEYIQENSKSLFVIDHHKTSYERLKKINKNNYVLSMDNAGVGLTWKHFYENKDMPIFIKYLEDRDMWWNKLDYCKEVFLSISTLKKNFELWLKYIEKDSIDNLIEMGKVLKLKEDDNLNQLLKSSYTRKFIIDNNEYNVAYINSKLYRSDLGNMLMKKYKDIDFAGCYYYEGKYNSTQFSLRSLEFDVSEVARLFDGGGHKCASGLSIKGFHNRLPLIKDKILENNKI